MRVEMFSIFDDLEEGVTRIHVVYGDQNAPITVEGVFVKFLKDRGRYFLLLKVGKWTRRIHTREILELGAWM